MAGRGADRGAGNDETGSNADRDADYFQWQKSIGEFGGWANLRKFANFVRPADTVIDFGCGGGFLLANLDCERKFGIDPNPHAAAHARALGVACFASPLEARRALGEEVADVIVSDNALEHALDPLAEIKSLRPLLKVGGAAHFFVPCDSAGRRFRPDDRNRHFFSWSPQNLGNLFIEAGYAVEQARPFIHKWPPFYRTLAKLGWPAFDVACRIWGRVERSWFQVEIRAKRTAD